MSWGREEGRNEERGSSGGRGGVEPGKGESGKEAGRLSPAACRAAGPREGAKGKVSTAGARVSAGGSREPGERGDPPEAIGVVQTGELEGASPAYRQDSFALSVPEGLAQTSDLAGLCGRGCGASEQCLSAPTSENQKSTPPATWKWGGGSWCPAPRRVGVGGRIEVVRELREEGRLCLVWFSYQSERKGSKIRN